MELSYKVHNPNDIEKPWVILINGLFASQESWENVIDLLTIDFRVLTYDGRGQGESPRPLGVYYLKDQVNDLKRLLEKVEIREVFLLGLSNGGRIALEFSRRYPACVLGCAASDTYERVSTLLKYKLSSWLEANRIGGPTHRFDVATPWVWGETIVENNPKLIEEFRKNAHKEKLHVIEGLIQGAISSDDINLEEIDVSVLLTVGEEDLLTPAFLHQRMVKKLKQGSLAIIPGGHASLLEYPQSVTNIIVPYFKTFLNHSSSERIKIIEEKEDYGVDRIS